MSILYGTRGGLFASASAASASAACFALCFAAISCCESGASSPLRSGVVALGIAAAPPYVICFGGGPNDAGSFKVERGAD